MPTLKEVRQVYRCSQRDLARWTGISVSRIRDIELGRSEPTAAETNQLQEAFARAGAQQEAMGRYEGQPEWPARVQADMRDFVRQQTSRKKGKK